MGRALMSNPKLLMLDEPSMGLAPILVEQIFDIISELHAAGTTILLVEQNAQMALSIADRAYVLETGKITLSGTGDELLHNDEVRKAYLGEQPRVQRSGRRDTGRCINRTPPMGIPHGGVSYEPSMSECVIGAQSGLALEPLVKGDEIAVARAGAL